MIVLVADHSREFWISGWQRWEMGSCSSVYVRMDEGAQL